MWEGASSDRSSGPHKKIGSFRVQEIVTDGREKGGLLFGMADGNGKQNKRGGICSEMESEGDGEVKCVQNSMDSCVWRDQGEMERGTYFALFVRRHVIDKEDASRLCRLDEGFAQSKRPDIGRGISRWRWAATSVTLLP